MNLILKSYGIARDIMNSPTTNMTDVQVQTIGDLKNLLIVQYPAFKELLKFSLAVDEEYREDDYSLSDNDEVIIIPPVSGG